MPVLREKDKNSATASRGPGRPQPRDPPEYFKNKCEECIASQTLCEKTDKRPCLRCADKKSGCSNSWLEEVGDLVVKVARKPTTKRRAASTRVDGGIKESVAGQAAFRLTTPATSTHATAPTPSISHSPVPVSVTTATAISVPITHPATVLATIENIRESLTALQETIKDMPLARSKVLTRSVRSLNGMLDGLEYGQAQGQATCVWLVLMRRETGVFENAVDDGGAVENAFRAKVENLKMGWGVLKAALA